MIRRLLGNPAFVVLLVLTVIGASVAQWAVGLTVDDDGFGWSGEPTAEQLMQLNLLRLAQFAATPAAFLAVTAVIGMLALASATASASAAARHAPVPASAAAPTHASAPATAHASAPATAPVSVPPAPVPPAPVPPAGAAVTTDRDDGRATDAP